MKLVPMIPEEQPPTPEPGQETAALVADPVKTAELQPGIQAALKKVYDPEIPVDIWELGLTRLRVSTASPTPKWTSSGIRGGPRIGCRTSRNSSWACGKEAGRC
jgi:hypothetical protein